VLERGGDLEGREYAEQKNQTAEDEQRFSHNASLI
jgi:hypothetical protein